MNGAVFNAARRAGCTARESEAIATYAESETLDDAARKLGISDRWLLKLLRQARNRVDAPHNVALVANVLSIPEPSTLTR